MSKGTSMDSAAIITMDPVQRELETIRRSTDLHALEAIVRRGLGTALETAVAIRRIHDGGLYKLTHSSWESYSQYLGVSVQRAHQLMAFARISTQVNAPVPTERHARELARVPDEEQQEVMEEATARAGGKTPSVATVREVVKERLPDEKQKPPRIQNRRTPRWLFDFFVERFGPFALDAFADELNALCPTFYTKEANGCVKPWIDQTFGNPEFEDMWPPVEQAVRQAEAGIRSILLGPVGCSQGWYHKLAIRGTIYAPDSRFNYDLPDGTPTTGADRDTIVMGFGGPHVNPYWRRGEFRVLSLELPDRSTRA